MFDSVHKFIDKVIRHVDDLLFEEIELCSESGKDCFEIENGLCEGIR